MKFIINDTTRLADWQNTKRLANWLKETQGWSICEPYTAIGAENAGGKIICVSVFNNYNGRDMEWTVAGRMTRGLWRVSLEFAFETNNCRRITMRTKASNKHCIKSMTHLGAWPEGRLRRYYENDEDALVFGLLREDCKYVQYF